MYVYCSYVKQNCLLYIQKYDTKTNNKPEKNNFLTFIVLYIQLEVYTHIPQALNSVKTINHTNRPDY